MYKSQWVQDKLIAQLDKRRRTKGGKAAAAGGPTRQEAEEQA